MWHAGEEIRWGSMDHDDNGREESIVQKKKNINIICSQQKQLVVTWRYLIR